MQGSDDIDDMQEDLEDLEAQCKVLRASLPSFVDPL